MTDIGGSIVGQELIVLADDLHRIANRLHSVQLANASDGHGFVSPLERARRHYRDRRMRTKIFGSDELFGEPAWDIMVDLFIAAEEGKRISVSSLCIASCVPMTTALRWIAILENQGSVIRTPDEIDTRRSHLALSAEAVSRVRAYFREHG